MSPQLTAAQHQYDVGVIIARFQVPDLTPGHIDLLDTVFAAHRKVLVILGKAPVDGSTNNPLDVESRRQMIHEVYPSAVIVYVKDRESDVDWAKDVDEKILDALRPNQTACIYGSRDSFIEHYPTKTYPTVELEQAQFVSGSQVRKDIEKSGLLNDRAARWGAIWQALTGYYPTAYSTADLVPHRNEKLQILLAKRKGAKRYRFIGGFVMPFNFKTGEGDVSPLEAGIREGGEETGGELEFGKPELVGWVPIDDWRYRGEPHGILTTVVSAEVTHGTPRPSDDLEGGELRWFALKLEGATSQVLLLRPTDLVPEHRPILELIQEKGL